MGLWEPGTVNYVTPTIIHAVCKQAWIDHKGGEEFTGPLRNPKEMHVTELVALDAETGDGAFDRCSYAMRANEVFHLNGAEVHVTAYHGNWSVDYVDDSERGFRFDERTLADVLTKQNGPHPNPYVARIEVAYASVARAGYGIRRDGTFDLWYD